MIAVATPTRDQVNGTFAFDLARLLKEYPDSEYFSVMGSYIQNARLELVKWSLDYSGLITHILFIDSDMRFPPDTVERLLKHDKDIVGANCKQRVRDEWTARKNGKFISSTDKTGIEEVDTLGFGVTLIKRELFDGKLRKVPEPWFNMPYHTKEKRFIGEDIYFCTVAREQGFKIWIDHDLSQQVKHTGTKEY